MADMRQTLEDLSSREALKDLLDFDVLWRWMEAAEPERARQLLTYLGEGAFFAGFFDAEIRRLAGPSSVLEIGSGIGLLARIIAARGHRVVGYEPQTAGFGAMRELSEVIASAWRGPSPDLEVRGAPFSVATAPDGERFDLVISVNVIEHVPDPAGLVSVAVRHLSARGRARFICPNYAFPYEPHLNIPTLISKRLTERVFRHRVAPQGDHTAAAFWNDLSWPTQRGLSRALRAAGVRHAFDREIVLAYAGRLSDRSFLMRKGRAVTVLAPAIGLCARVVARVAPRALLPVVDLVCEPR